MRLYRPTGLQELALVFRAQMKAWPPRLDDQPIFYPVMNVAYAREIAKGWNTKFDSCVGYVTQFEVDETYISQFSVEIVGDKTNAELWIPAEELATFNDHMIGDIEVVEAHFGRGFLERILINAISVFSSFPMRLATYSVLSSSNRTMILSAFSIT